MLYCGLCAQFIECGVEQVGRTAPAHSVVFPFDDNWKFFFFVFFSVMMVLQNGKIPAVASCRTP